MHCFLILLIFLIIELYVNVDSGIYNNEEDIGLVPMVRTPPAPADDGSGLPQPPSVLTLGRATTDPIHNNTSSNNDQYYYYTSRSHPQQQHQQQPIQAPPMQNVQNLQNVNNVPQHQQIHSPVQGYPRAFAVPLAS